MRERQYHVYILASNSRRLYVGVTGNLIKRVWEHKTHAVEGFTKRYNIDHLVYYSGTSDVLSALAEEKRIKGLLRVKKIALIEADNPQWQDLSTEWYDKESLRL